MTQLTEHGISTTKDYDCFHYESYESSIQKKTLYQWDYRDKEGNLHSGVAQSLEAAKAKAALYGYNPAP